jgi:glyoxylase-like metal-dependent hydrolase (beta-lactamase superfamily II)
MPIPTFPAPVEPRSGPRADVADVGISVNGISVHAVVDAVVDYPFPLEVFYPDVPSGAWEQWRDRFPETFWARDRHTLDYTAYLIQCAERTILVDCGMGPAGAPMPRFVQSLPSATMTTHQPHRLLRGLSRIGIGVEDVDVVVFTHLDVDHVGWALTADAESGVVPTFPRARYIVDLADWNAYHSPGWDSKAPFDYVGESVTPLAGLGVLDLVTDDVPLDECVTFLRATGHTPGHRVVRVAGGDEVAYLLGDAIVHPAQVAFPHWRNMADVDPDLTRRTRSSLLDRIEEEGALMAATHFPRPWFGRIERVGDHRIWQPIDL